jgi:hypothetical protein
VTELITDGRGVRSIVRRALGSLAKVDTRCAWVPRERATGPRSSALVEAVRRSAVALFERWLRSTSSSRAALRGVSALGADGLVREVVPRTC